MSPAQPGHVVELRHIADRLAGLRDNIPTHNGELLVIYQCKHMSEEGYCNGRW